MSGRAENSSAAAAAAWVCRPLRFAGLFGRRKPHCRKIRLRRQRPQLRLILACELNLEIRRRRPLVEETPWRSAMRLARASLTPELAFFVAKSAARPLKLRRLSKNYWAEAKGFTAAGAANVWGAGRHIAQHRGCDACLITIFHRSTVPPSASIV